ncbi:MAG TPA: hypothetical protein VEL47_02495, partial [Myxococcota bacterium]|nr:hypothetical protein [Myxococcota bacterium]
QKNAIMKGVKKALVENENFLRDLNIGSAVINNGNYPDLADAIKAEVAKLFPNLKTWGESYLPHEVYQVIADRAGATTAEKNAIMDAVKAAMDLPKDQQVRDAAIQKAVNDNGAQPGFAAAIKTKLDKVEPIAKPAVLMTRAEADLPQNVYDVIANHSTAKTREKNAIMTAVSEAIKKGGPFLRDYYVDRAVSDNGRYAGLAASIKKEVNLAHPVLVDWLDSRLPLSIYNLIADRKDAKIVDRNAIMVAVKAAMDARPKVQATRDAAIAKAVNDNGAYPGLIDKIKSAVNAYDPIAVVVTLKTKSESGLPEEVYDVIASHYLASNAEKNLIMAKVKAAMAVTPKNQIAREKAIEEAVRENGAYYGLANDIKKAVDTVDPILAPLKTRLESGLPQEVYDVIKNHPRATTQQKNAIMADVKEAIAFRPKSQAKRDTNILLAVIKNGNYSGFDEEIKKAVDSYDPITVPINLKTWVESDLPVSVYNVIEKHPSATIKEKNSIMEGVKEAMDRRPKDQFMRDFWIDFAVKYNGNYPGLANQIKAAVNASDPISVPVTLKTRLESGLPQSIYDVIKNHPSASVVEKNAIMIGVRWAMTFEKNNQAGRDKVIATAVASNGNYHNLASDIKKAVDAYEPISVPEVLITQSASKLPQSVYEVIAKHAGRTIRQKNAIMVEVLDAILRYPDAKALRDAGISHAVKISGGGWDALLIDAITKEVDKAYPIKSSAPAVDEKLLNTFYDAWEKGDETAVAKLVPASLKKDFVDFLSEKKSFDASFAKFYNAKTNRFIDENYPVNFNSFYLGLNHFKESLDKSPEKTSSTGLVLRELVTKAREAVSLLQYSYMKQWLVKTKKDFAVLKGATQATLYRDLTNRLSSWNVLINNSGSFGLDKLKDVIENSTLKYFMTKLQNIVVDINNLIAEVSSEAYDLSQSIKSEKLRTQAEDQRSNWLDRVEEIPGLKIP